MVEDQGDGHAEHGEGVGEVHGPVEGVDDPGWGVGHEVVAGGARGVRLLPDERMSWVGCSDSGVDVGFDGEVGGRDDVDGGVFVFVAGGGWVVGAASFQGGEENSAR